MSIKAALVSIHSDTAGDIFNIRSLNVSVGRTAHRVNNSLQGLKSIIYRKDMVLTVSNLCQLEERNSITITSDKYIALRHRISEAYSITS